MLYKVTTFDHNSSVNGELEIEAQYVEYDTDSKVLTVHEDYDTSYNIHRVLNVLPILAE